MATGRPDTRQGGDTGQDRSTVRLLKDIADDTTTLVRKELELFRQEVTEAITARVKAAIAAGLAGLLGLFALVFLATALAWGLEGPLPDWAAWLIVAGIFGVLAVGGFLFAKRRFKVPPLAPEETKRTVKEDVEWAKTQLKR